MDLFYSSFYFFIYFYLFFLSFLNCIILNNTLIKSTFLRICSFSLKSEQFSTWLNLYLIKNFIPPICFVSAGPGSVESSSKSLYCDMLNETELTSDQFLTEQAADWSNEETRHHVAVDVAAGGISSRLSCQPGSSAPPGSSIHWGYLCKKSKHISRKKNTKR